MSDVDVLAAGYGVDRHLLADFTTFGLEQNSLAEGLEGHGLHKPWHRN